MQLNHVHCGDVLEVLKTLPDESVNCCVTSPPYWGLRDYGQDGQLGLEKTPEEYVQHMVEVFREVRRVLKSDGTLWLNLGDCYASYRDGKCIPQTVGGGQRSMPTSGASNRGKSAFEDTKIKHKDLVGIPWMVAFALRTDGWYLRSDIIWNKSNPMPESVKDRPTKAHEYIFLMTKSSKYYYDADSIREPYADIKKGSSATFRREKSKRNIAVFPYNSYATHRPDRKDKVYGHGGRNKRTVWTVSTKPFKGAHFATFPTDLIEPCILAGCPKDGVVLDPFFGAGTTGLVVQQHGRNYIGIELNPAYIEIATSRIVSAIAERKRMEPNYVQTKLLL